MKPLANVFSTSQDKHTWWHPLSSLKSSLLSLGHVHIFPGALVSVEPGEGARSSRLGHHAGLAPHPLLRVPASRLGRLRPRHHSGNPAAGDPRASRAIPPRETQPFKLPFLPPQRFQHLCSPAKVKSSLALRHVSTNGSMRAYSHVPPLDGKPTEQIAELIQEKATWRRLGRGVPNCRILTGRRRQQEIEDRWIWM